MSVIPAFLRDGVWTTDPGFGVYVHIPFCTHRCHYCDFNTYEGQESLHQAYVDAVISDIAGWTGETPPATSVFFGGGTPTLLTATDLGRILAAIEARIGIEPGAEITVEANPETVDEVRFRALRHAGFTRVSIGVQSTVPHVLKGLGRTHGPETALQAIAAARSAGFDEINADLIYGSPWESSTDWLRSVAAVVEAEPTHISAYALTVEEGTPLATMVRTGRVRDVDPDVQAERHGIVSQRLEEAGYVRYEVSNWARPGSACRHNLVYWCAGDYAAFGAGAHGHLSGRRWWNLRLPRTYIDAASSTQRTEAGSEQLDADARAGEALMLGLRLVSGIDVAGFVDRFGVEPWARRLPGIEAELARGHLVSEGGRVRLAPGATMLANDVIARVM